MNMTNEIREIFLLFDKNNNGLVQTTELGNLVRAINLNPTNAEVEEMKKKIDPTNSGHFKLSSLENLIKERGKDQDSLQDVIEALKVFDHDRDGKIPLGDFKKAMLSMGEKMSETELQEILEDGDLIGGGTQIEIEEFAKLIMNRI